MPHCVQCGTPLNIDEASRVLWKDSLKDDAVPTAYLRADEFGQTDSTPDERDTLAREMQKLKTRKQKGAELQMRMRGNEPSQPGSGVDVLEGQSDQSANSILLVRRSESDNASRSESETRHKVRFMDDTGTFIEARTYDPLIPDYPRDHRPSHTRYQFRSMDPLLQDSVRDKRKVFRRCLIAALVIVLLGGIGVFVWKTFFSSGDEVSASSNAIIEASMLNDLAAHRIMIPGENGTSIYISELHYSYPVSDGYATVEVADHTWYDDLEGVLDETMDVTLTPFLKTSSDTQRPLPVITYTIDIPSSPITLETPETMRTTVSTTMAAIKIVVRPGSRVTINGEDLSDTVNSQTGEMTHNAIVQPIGDNVFNITVRSQYCRDNTIRVILYREPQEIPLDLAAGTYGTTNSAIMPVTATTLPGARIEVTTPHTDLNITELDTSGKFTFNATFDHIGDNTITIIASYPGRKPSQVDHTVYYVPNVDVYTRKAWALDPGNYSDLLNTIALRASKNQVYVIKGIVQYSISEKPQMVVINSSDDGKSQPVLLENKTKMKWVVGQYYRIYADAYSTYNSMPYLIARYSYPK